MPDDTTIGTVDVTDDTNTSFEGLAKRLESVARVQKNMNKRLEKIKAGMACPPDDIKPSILGGLVAVKEQAKVANDLADEMARIVSAPPTDVPR